MPRTRPCCPSNPDHTAWAGMWVEDHGKGWAGHAVMWLPPAFWPEAFLLPHLFPPLPLGLGAQLSPRREGISPLPAFH